MRHATKSYNVKRVYFSDTRMLRLGIARNWLKSFNFLVTPSNSHKQSQFISVTQRQFCCMSHACVCVWQKKGKRSPDCCDFWEGLYYRQCFALFLRGRGGVRQCQPLFSFVSFYSPPPFGSLLFLSSFVHALFFIVPFLLYIVLAFFIFFPCLFVILA